jgi:hypothetical protein
MPAGVMLKAAAGTPGACIQRMFEGLSEKVETAGEERPFRGVLQEGACLGAVDAKLHQML